MANAALHSRPILDIDIGNSRIKWRLRGGDGEARGVILRGDPLGSNGWPDVRASRVRVSSVAAKHEIHALVRWLESHFECRTEFAQTTRSAAGVVCGYEDPARLGVDRWLAMLSGRQLSSGPFVVIDLGTAATIDFVRDNGTHGGGFIVPGLRMMTDALLRGTADVQVTFDAPTDGVDPGKNTQDAVRRGVVLMLADFANASIRRFTTASESAPRVYLCGGDASVIAPLVDAPVEIRAELVLDGLALALP